jgi:hypothetical protein
MQMIDRQESAGLCVPASGAILIGAIAENSGLEISGLCLEAGIRPPAALSSEDILESIYELRYSAFVQECGINYLLRTIPASLSKNLPMRRRFICLHGRIGELLDACGYISGLSHRYLRAICRSSNFRLCCQPRRAMFPGW